MRKAITVAGSFVVAAGADGEYTVSVTVFRSNDGPFESGSAFFDADEGGPVGGFMEPVNKSAGFAPYLALLGVLAVMVIAAVPWEKRDMH